MKKYIVGASFALAVACGSAKADPIVVDFTFVGDADYPGTVTGELDFASAGTGIAATHAYVLTSTSASVPAPGLSFDFAQSYNANSFDVTADGTVTAVNFFAQGSTEELLLNANGFGQNDFQNFVSNTAVYNQDGFSGVSYAAASVPEPTTMALLAVGLVGLGTIRKFSRNV